MSEQICELSLIQIDFFFFIMLFNNLLLRKENDVSFIGSHVGTKGTKVSITRYSFTFIESYNPFSWNASLAL